MRKHLLCFIASACVAVSPGYIPAQNIAYALNTNSRVQITAATADSSLRDLLQQVQKRYHINLLFEDKLINGLSANFDLASSNEPVETVLKKLVQPHGLKIIKINDTNYSIVSGRKKTTYVRPVTTYNVTDTGGERIIVRQPGPPDIVAVQAMAAKVYGDKILITGTVVNENNEPLPGASVFVKGRANNVTRTDGTVMVANVRALGGITNEAGEFKVYIPENTKEIFVQYVGYETKTIEIGNKTNFVVAMKKASKKLDDIVVTGMFGRKKESFTGATATFTGEQLKVVGNQNLIQSLKTLDPSFIVMDNNVQGSNPNSLPNIEIRGQSSISNSALKDEFNSDPNQPLFVLDGFRVSLQIINNLDINRIGSVTILKDAASTALYGAQAANGVVVIETKKPRPGKMRLSYSGDFNVQAPDLSGYNMMNSTEELQFEKLAGRYTMGPNTASWPNQYYLDDLYSKHLALVQQGTDTYWLNEPVQTGFTSNTNLYADGGDATTRYGLGFNYKNISGVMKGSGRQNWGGSFDFSYRKGKFNLSNKLYLNGYNATESPYGSFSNFVKAPAYFQKRDSLGIAQKYLEVSKDYLGSTFYVFNPLYNALLPSTNSTKSFGYNENLQLIYTILPELQLQGAISINQNTTSGVTFISPENTLFQDSSIFTKGKYTNKKVSGFNYQTNVMLTYGKLFNGVHQVTANLRAEAEQTRNEMISFTAVGFPAGSTGNPAFAFGYPTNAKPGSVTSVFRRNNLLGSLNYSFDNRYFADFTYRLDGSTAFGSDNKFSPFWSIGAGWNIHNEAFLNKAKWLNTLRLRASVGTSGNQNFGSITSIATYVYDSYINQFGQGVDLATLANPNLTWPLTTSKNLGLDVVAFESRLSLTGNVYTKVTDPLIVLAPLPSSTGINSYPLNTGTLVTKGMDLGVGYKIINNLNKRIMWTLGGTIGMLESKYQNFNNTLAGLNKQNQLSKSLERYVDGNSPTDIWAVRSAGIDPSTGQEVFIKRDGQYTFTYDVNDVVQVGNTQPKAQGVISTNFRYKGFTFSAAMRYSVGASVYNSALYNKVENISYLSVGNNQDKRALYDRWQKPGDNAPFKGIYLVTAKLEGATPISSRFVQKENYISGESFSLGYDFLGQKWIKTLGMESFRITAYANDIFRVSTVQRERGIDYPFANTFSFSVNAAF
ncbi:SusC/RagA family TonB-linked outer membrane protein [Chitinophagaceae bacterium 26-R-25]|nr:SusC/RagA family TonB-linked outer membrane protein [Chitinophagaceae bacterium 26-R-25]